MISNVVRSRRVIAVLALVGALVLNLPAAAAPQVAPQDNWLWPTGGPVPVLRAFDPPAQRWLPGHRGVDLSVPVGAEILAPADGTVIYAGILVDRPVVSVQHESGLRLTFEPVEPSVAQGQVVSRGQLLGTLVGGHAQDALHWGAKLPMDQYIDPLTLVLGPVRLKPWD